MAELQPPYTELVARKKKNTPRQGGPLQVISRVMTPMNGLITGQLEL